MPLNFRSFSLTATCWLGLSPSLFLFVVFFFSLFLFFFVSVLMPRSCAQLAQTQQLLTATLAALLSWQQNINKGKKNTNIMCTLRVDQFEFITNYRCQLKPLCDFLCEALRAKYC